MAAIRIINPRQVKISALALATLLIFGVGWIVADTVTRPLRVELRTHIKICKQSEKGGWEVVDEVGPESLRFDATLLEMAAGQKVGSDFVFETKTKKGQAYRVRLADRALLNYNPVTGSLVGNVTFEVTLGNRTAKVPARLTTESVSGPLGSLRGSRARGQLGRAETRTTLVSANRLLLPGGADPLMLLCTEEYKLTPKS